MADSAPARWLALLMGLLPAYGWAQEAPDFAVMAAQEIQRLEGEVRGAYGVHKPFQVVGSVTSRTQGLVMIFGKALPLRHGPGVLGAHWEDACLWIEDPEAHGDFVPGRYIADRVYYLRQGVGQNVFGANVYCSVYGALPPETAHQVKQVRARITVPQGAFHEATVRERTLLQTIKTELARLDAEIEQMERSRPSGGELVSEAARVRLRDSYRQIQSLRQRKELLQAQATAVQQYLSTLSRGRRDETFDALLTRLEAQEAETAAAAREAELSQLGSTRERLQAEIARRQEDLARQAEIFEDNAAAEARRGVVNPRRRAAYERTKGVIEAQIQSLRLELEEINNRIAGTNIEH